jgi:hypothetical protein
LSNLQGDYLARHDVRVGVLQPCALPLIAAQG